MISVVGLVVGRLHAPWAIPDDFMTESHFKRTVLNLDWTSSPGYPYMKDATTNQQLLGVLDGNPDPEKEFCLWQVVKRQIERRLVDPIRLFIKPEAHKQKKLDSGAYRLISSVSVVDQIIDHMLFDPFLDTLKDNHPINPIKMGWSPVRGGWKSMSFRKPYALDRSAWDWTCKPWIFEGVYEVIKNTCTNLKRDWEDLATWRFTALYGSPQFITSDGVLLRQKQPGVQKSGAVLTTAGNSVGVLLVDTLIRYRLGMPFQHMAIIGDDSLSEEPPNEPLYREVASQFNVVKEPVFETSFAGFTYKFGGVVEPEYLGKHCFNLLHMKPELVDQMCASYELLYHRSTNKAIIIEEFRNVAKPMLTSAEMDCVYDR